MNKTEVRDLIYRELGPLLPGFKAKPRAESFERTIPQGKQALMVAIVDYKPEFRFSLVLTIRLEAVQQIVNQFSGSPPRYHKITTTTLTQLDWFFPGEPKPKQYSVTNEQDIVAAVKQLAPILQQKILPFFDCYKDVKTIDEMINRLDPSPDGTQMPVRAMTALAVAWLAGNPDFDELAAKYLSQMRGAPAMAQKFTALIEHLRQLKDVRHE
jgi:hypothetical protein